MIKVTDYTKTAFSMEDAEALAPVIEKLIEEDKKIDIDFSGIKYYTTLFFNNAITKYVVTLGTDKYKEKFNLRNLSEVGRTTYEHSLNNAETFSKLSPDERPQAEDIIANTLEDNE